MKTPRDAFLAAVLIVWFGVSIANSQTVEWARQLGAPGNDVGSSVFADGLGNVYISGHTRGILDGMDVGEGNTFLSKYDEKGDLEWTRQFGDLSFFNWNISRKYNGVAADSSGNIYTSGTIRVRRGLFPLVLNKHDPDGNLVWTRQIGSTPLFRGADVSVDGNGNVFITGSTRDSLEGTNAGFVDAFVSKFDGEGNLDWTSQLDFSGDDESRGVSVDGLGNVYISGFTNGSVDGPNAGLQDAFLVKLNDETFVPEPSSLLLVLLAMTVLAGRCRVD